MASARTAVTKNFFWFFRTTVVDAEKVISAGTGSDSDSVSISNDSYGNLLMVARLDVLDYSGGAPWDYEMFWLYQ